MDWFSRRRRPATTGSQRPELPKGRSRLRVGRANEGEIRNLAMSLVLLWGASRSIPPVERLRMFVSGLDEQTAETMVADARAAAQLAENHVYMHTDYTGEQIRYVPKQDVARLVLARFPWVDADNMGHVYSQSCYYAWHG